MIEAASQPIQPGDVIAGKFRVERVLGMGGVGMVVAAQHLQLGETVALKFMLSTVSQDSIDVARFIREAQSAAKLKNEHVARIHDVGSLDDGSPYMVMEYLQGRDLSEVLKSEGPLPVNEAVEYILQVCEAVAEAHANGIIHRDLKPSNCFLTERSDGSALIKVLDFGIAKARLEFDQQQDVSLTQTRALLGSPVYMSPEQVRSARSVDERSDIWSLGITFYELLTDTLPFGGDSVTGVAAAITTDAVPPIRGRRPEIPPGLAVVIEQCLAKLPSERFASVAELAEALVPFGPEHADLYLQRIKGTLGFSRSRSGTTSRNGRGSIPSASSSRGQETTADARPRGKFLVLGVIATAVFVGLGTWTLFRRANQGNMTPTSLSPSSTAAVKPTDLPSSTAVRQELKGLPGTTSAEGLGNIEEPSTSPSTASGTTTVEKSDRVSPASHGSARGKKEAASIATVTSKPTGTSASPNQPKPSPNSVFDSVIDTRK